TANDSPWPAVEPARFRVRSLSSLVTDFGTLDFGSVGASVPLSPVVRGCPRRPLRMRRVGFGIPCKEQLASNGSPHPRPPRPRGEGGAARVRLEGAIAGAVVAAFCRFAFAAPRIGPPLLWGEGLGVRGCPV